MKLRKWSTLAAVGVFALLAAVTTGVSAQDVIVTASQTQAPPFTLAKVFTFLFLTLGPLKILGPFASMTRGHDAAFKRQLAVRGIVIATIALLAAATIGASILQKWGISIGAMHLTAGIVLFLVALRPVLEQYERTSRKRRQKDPPKRLRNPHPRWRSHRSHSQRSSRPTVSRCSSLG